MIKVAKATVLYSTAAVFFLWFLIGRLLAWVITLPVRIVDNLLFASYVDVVYKVAMKQRPNTLIVPDKVGFRRDAYRARGLYRTMQKLAGKGQLPLWKLILTDTFYVKQAQANRDFLRLQMALWYYIDDFGGFDAFHHTFRDSVLTFEFLGAVRDYIEHTALLSERLHEWKDSTLPETERISAFIWSTQLLFKYAHPVYTSHPSIFQSRPLLAKISALYEDIDAIHRMAYFVLPLCDAGKTEMEARALFFEQEGILS